jgi:hypothetical protein
MRSVSATVFSVFLAVSIGAHCASFIAPMSATNRLVTDTNETVLVELLPQPVGLGQEVIAGKLARIHLDELGPWDNLPLSEVVGRLSIEARKRGPKGKGVSFRIHPNTIAAANSANAASRIGKTSRPSVPSARAHAPVDTSAVRITIDPALTSIRLADALNAICAVADQPIHWSLEDDGVVFFPKAAPHMRQAQLALVTMPRTKVILSWSVFTNGVMDSASSRSRVYAAREVAITNVVSLGLLHGRIIGIPGGPMAVKVPAKALGTFSVAHWLGDVVGHGGILASRRRVTLMELTWGYGLWADHELGRVLLQAEAAPLHGLRGREIPPTEGRQ